jgi:uroporphyrinogen-III decarboxylase
VFPSLLRIAKPDEVKAYCKKLIDIAGNGGWFIMSNGVFFDEARPENIKAMVDVSREYGVYK